MMDRTVLKNLRQQLKQEREEAQRLEDEYAREHAKYAMGALIEYLQEDLESCKLLADKSPDELRDISLMIRSRLPEMIDDAELCRSLRQTMKKR